MQTQNTLKNPATFRVRITSLTWAISFVVPLIVLAAARTDNRIYFHSFLFLTGWFSWTYTEYFFHRFIMHTTACKKGLGKLFNHSHHHQDPADIRLSKLHRLLLIAGSIFFIILSCLLDDYFTFLSGYVVGITGYSFMHVILHHQWSVKIFPQLHRFHIHHHCRHRYIRRANP